MSATDATLSEPPGNHKLANQARQAVSIDLSSTDWEAGVSTTQNTLLRGLWCNVTGFVNFLAAGDEVAQKYYVVAGCEGPPIIISKIVRTGSDAACQVANAFIGLY